jgi:hypothetical protein
MRVHAFVSLNDYDSVRFQCVHYFQMPGYFVNEINNCVDDSLIGYVRAHNHLELAGRAVIARAQVPSVAVISGNGSGHEPAMVKQYE